jgi:hypothetical protein
VLWIYKKVWLYLQKIRGFVYKGKYFRIFIDKSSFRLSYMWSRGWCDLQDITLFYGSDKGRFYEKFKKTVTNLNTCGPLIKTIWLVVFYVLDVYVLSMK